MNDRKLDRDTICAVEILLESFDEFILTNNVVTDPELLLDLEVARHLIFNRIGIFTIPFLDPCSALRIRQDIQCVINQSQL